ncbi:MAG: NADP-dependent oxidoreductase [Sneathiellaceae bacterium]
MSAMPSREIRLRSRPEGMPAPGNFELGESQVAEPGPGQMRIRNIWMTVDPYMRGRMVDRRSYVPPFQIGQPLDGGAVGEVVDSRVEGFAPGDYVVGPSGGWREVHLTDGRGFRKVDPAIAPLQTFLGTLGMPGLTAYVGLTRIGEAKAGETVFVTAASGAVGTVACQIARNRGCRVVGSAGSDEKTAWLLEEARIDAAINYRKTGDLQAAMAQACPKGIDVYFENVGGAHLRAALNLANPFGRLVMCGMIEQYNEAVPPPGPDNLILVIGKSLRMQGFIVSNHGDMAEDFLREMAGWIAEGRMTWQETVVEGLERAPEAFLGLFTGANTGKMLVRVGPDRS